jgi:hypothetical protein
MPMLVFSENALIEMCLAHVRENYQQRARITMESDQISSRQYLIRSIVGRKRYIFSIDIHGHVEKVVLKDGKKRILLPLPDWEQPIEGDDFVQNKRHAPSLP